MGTSLLEFGDAPALATNDAVPAKALRKLANGTVIRNTTGSTITTSDPIDESLFDACERLVERLDKTTRVVQNAHGFTLARGNVLNVYVDQADGLYKLAQANSADTVRTTSIVQVVDANTFLIQDSGDIDIGAHGLTPGAEMYLSPASAGQWTATRPTDAGHYVQFVATVLDATRVTIRESDAFEVGFGQPDAVPTTRYSANGAIADSDGRAIFETGVTAMTVATTTVNRKIAFYRSGAADVTITDSGGASFTYPDPNDPESTITDTSITLNRPLLEFEMVWNGTGWEVLP